MIGAYIQVFKNDGKADFVINNFRKHFIDSPIFLVSDKGDDFSYLEEKYKVKYIYSNINLGKYDDGYNKEQTLIWLSRLRESINFCKTDYLLYLEDDVLVRSNNLQLTNTPVTGVTETPIPFTVINFFQNLTGNIFNCHFYGACGGAIYKSDLFIKEYDRIFKMINENWKDISNLQYNENIKVRFGFLDLITPVLFMALGYKYERNINLIESSRNSNWKETNHPLVHGKDIYE